MQRTAWLMLLVLAATGCLQSSSSPPKKRTSLTTTQPDKPETPAPAKKPTGETPEPPPPQTFQPAEDKELAALQDVPVDELVAKLSDDQERSLATRALAERGADAVAPLVEALASDDAQVRAAAAFTLGQLGEDAAPAQERLQEMSASDESEIAKDAATFALDALEGN